MSTTTTTTTTTNVKGFQASYFMNNTILYSHMYMYMCICEGTQISNQVYLVAVTIALKFTTPNSAGAGDARESPVH